MRRPAARNDDGFTLVELLVVVVLLGVVAGGTLSVVVTATRANTYSEELRTVMDDGRVSLDRIRKELRGGRRVLDGSDAFHLYWWVDQNQNGLQELSERVHYCVTTLGGDGTDCTSPPPDADKYQIVRWTDDDDPSSSRVIAKTLVDPEAFTGYTTPVEETETVHITLDLDVTGTARGPDSVTTQGSVRLRNVAY